MGVNQTSELYKGFIFDGIDSKGFGVYISGAGVYNAPERDIEEIEIPGRNGAYMLDRGRFHNITVTYPAGLFGTDGDEFAAGIRRLRNALASRRGYCKLIDEYNPLEYRMAVYRGGLEADPAAINGENKAAQFEIQFECKPQRFRIDGDQPVKMTDGGTIDNPTLFDAKPLLKADGYGSIGINGEEMNITLEPLGDTMLYPEITIGGALNPRSFQVDSNKWRTGDTITIRTDGNGTKVDFTVKAEGGWINDYSVDETPTARVTVRETKANNKVVRIDIATYPEPWTFTAGTPGSHAQQVSVSGTYGGSTPFNIILLYTLSYDGDSTFTVSNSVTNDTAAITYTRSITVGQINVMSTKTTFGHSVYIDLDIGEAYYIDGGSVISLNNTVVIPAELPTLKPGPNTITFDNTVDELDIVPRWWEV